MCLFASTAAYGFAAAPLAVGYAAAPLAYAAAPLALASPFAFTSQFALAAPTLLF